MQPNLLWLHFCDNQNTFRTPMKKALIITLLILGQQSLAMNGSTEDQQQPPLLDQWAPVIPAPRPGQPLLEQWMPERAYNHIRRQAQQEILTKRLFTGVTLMGNQ
jgi:hypothetical protein